MTNLNETATLAGGCFWCTEAIFKRLRGVASVLPGYTGGNINNPTYNDVSSGDTGHAEAIQIKFDPSQIPYQKILDVFWHTHNPTTPNQQGPDVGSQYRSAIFYHSEEQKKLAFQSKADFEKEFKYPDPVVTQIIPFERFFIAEDHHHNYYEKNFGAPYCEVVINPKIEKLLKDYKQDIKDEYLSDKSET